MLKFPLTMLLAVAGVVAAAAPSVAAQITPSPRDVQDETVGVEDPSDNPTSTVTTTFTSGPGVSSVSVTYTNNTTGETSTGSHSFGGAHSGTYKDKMLNTKKGDKVTVVKEYELANGQTVTRVSNITIQ